MSRVHETIPSHRITAVAWDSTHRMIHLTRKEAATTPRPAHASWGHGDSCCQTPYLFGSPLCASTLSYGSAEELWSMNGAPRFG